MSKKFKEIKWLQKPEMHDYPAALSYLRLIYTDEKAKELVNSLKSAEMTQFKAKDIFRASGLPLLGINNEHVEKNLKKIKNGEKLSPLLLVRDSINGKVIVADGYHRIVSAYSVPHGEDLWVPCKIV